jgi:hypothetical protein
MKKNKKLQNASQNLKAVPRFGRMCCPKTGLRNYLPRLGFCLFDLIDMFK